jgi:hypothetical protein
MSEATEPEPNTSVEKHRRHRVESLIVALREARAKETRADLGARMDTVIAVLDAGRSQRLTVVLPDDAGLVEIEQHLGLPDIDGDRQAWRRIRRDHDDRMNADLPAALYIVPPRKAPPERSSHGMPAEAEHERTSSGASGGRTRGG